MKGILLGYLTFFFLNATVFAMPQIYQTRHYYQIRGFTADDLRNQMNSLGFLENNQRYDAKTSWCINWHSDCYCSGSSQNQCYANSAQVTVHISTTLPEWENQYSAHSSLQAKWQNYIARLSIHEQGHEENGKETAFDMEKELLNVPPMPNCQSLQAALTRIAQQIIQQHNQWDVNYDQSTQHGRMQGAIFP
jgi:predicted secreted Zn-dependent protease